MVDLKGTLLEEKELVHTKLTLEDVDKMFSCGYKFYDQDGDEFGKDDLGNILLCNIAKFDEKNGVYILTAMKK